MAVRTLTTFQAACLIAGGGMGTGILSLPFAAQHMGLAGILIALGASAAASFLLYLTLSELTRRSNPPAQLPDILGRHLFTGKWGRAFRLTFFILFTFLLIQTLVVHVVVASQALEPITGLASQVGMCAFAAVALVVGLFGLKTVSVFEVVSVSLIACTLITLTVLAGTHQVRAIALDSVEPTKAVSLFSLFMYAFSAIFAVIQAAGHVPDAASLKRALAIGLGINAVCTLAFLLAALTASNQVTQVGTLGLADSVGFPAVRLICSLLIVLAMLTSYWPSLIAFAEVFKSTFGLPTGGGQLLASGIALGLALALPLSFLDYVKLAAGAISLVIVLLIIPAYRNSLRSQALPPLIGRTGGGRAVPIALAIVGLAMAAGSIL